jgi:plasmid stabilization system protein ParE
MTYHVEITAKALREIDEALEWYAVRSLRTAISWYVNLMEAVRDLGDNPERFELAPENEWYPGELRQMLYGKKRGTYRILFEIRGDTVYILRVRHGAQDFVAPEEM